MIRNRHKAGSTIEAKTLARIPEGGDIVKLKILSATNSNEEEEELGGRRGKEMGNSHLSRK